MVLTPSYVVLFVCLISLFQSEVVISSLGVVVKGERLREASVDLYDEGVGRRYVYDDDDVGRDDNRVVEVNNGGGDDDDDDDGNRVIYVGEDGDDDNRVIDVEDDGDEEEEGDMEIEEEKEEEEEEENEERKNVDEEEENEEDEEEENEDGKFQDSRVYNFKLSSSMKWEVDFEDSTSFEFEQDSCKERLEMDFDNLLTGTSKRDGIWTSKGTFISADATQRCPISGTCFGKSTHQRANKHTHTHTHTHQTKHRQNNTMPRCLTVHAEYAFERPLTTLVRFLRKS